MPMELTYLLAAEELTVTANPLISGASWFTNSMLVTMIVTVLVVIWARRSTAKMSLIPGGIQNLFEAVVETLYVTFEGIVGKHMIPKVFSLIATLFVFILAANWFGLVPGVGTIGFGEPGGGPLGLKEMAHQRSLPGAQEPGHDGDRNARAALPLEPAPERAGGRRGEELHPGYGFGIQKSISRM